MRGRGQWVAPAGDVGGRRVDRDVAVPEEHARQGLDLEVLDGVPLRLGEVANLTLRESQIVEDGLGNGLHDVRDAVLAQPERFGGPAVELLGVLPDGLVAVRADIGDDGGDGVDDGGVAGPLCRFTDGGLENE